MEIIDIILLAMVAGFILLRLRAELGSRTGNEPPPPAAGSRAPRREGPVIEPSGGRSTQPQSAGAEIVDLVEDPKLAGGYRDIRGADPAFSPGQFLEGAKAVYPMVLEAFWVGNRDTLRDYLSDDVYAQFEAAISAREAEGHSLDNRFIDLSEAEIIAARMAGRNAEITVRFVSELVSVTRDSEGRIIDGKASDAISVTDRWTFARDTASTEPKWTLVATRAG